MFLSKTKSFTGIIFSKNSVMGFVKRTTLKIKASLDLSDVFTDFYFLVAQYS